MPFSRTPLLALAVVFAAPAALAGPPPKQATTPAVRGHGTTAKLEPPARRGPVSRSIGSPTDGHLLGGARLSESPYLRIVPVYTQGDARWGLEPLVGLVERAARNVRKLYPDAVLSVGHLSRSGGGEIDRHASHESGRDADIGFYVKNQQGRSIFADHFVPFRGDGTAASWPGAQFDDAKNWALVASIVTDVGARVTHVFVTAPLRTRLLQYAEKAGAPLAVRTRAAELMMQPRGALPHDDHFHVRIGCPAGMDKCVELPLARKAPRIDGDKAAALASNHGATNPHGKAAAHGPLHAHPGEGVTAHKAAPPPPPKAQAESAGESLIPSLAPMIPGLDSALIPAPLGGTRPPSSEELPARAPPAEALPPIDDPDGVLERP